MLRFEKLKLDCNDHLYIFDGAHTNSGKTYKVNRQDIVCCLNDFQII